MEILEVGAVYTHTYNRVGASWFEAVRLDRELVSDVKNGQPYGRASLVISN